MTDVRDVRLRPIPSAGRAGERRFEGEVPKGWQTAVARKAAVRQLCERAAFPQAVASTTLIHLLHPTNRVGESTPEKIRFADLCGERGIWQRWSPGICPQRMPASGRPPINGPPPHRRFRSLLLASLHCLLSQRAQALSAGPSTPRLCPAYASQRFPYRTDGI